MFTVVTGGSGSGKSEFAEQLVLKQSKDGERRIYIATMQPSGDGVDARIRRHRAQRAGRGFVTVERYTDIGGLDLKDIPGLSDGRMKPVVLLECVSNLVANEFFQEGFPESGGKMYGEKVCRHVISGIRGLAEKCGNLVAVTNEIFSDGLCYGDLTDSYIRCMGLVNQRLSECAGTVYEVVYSIPVLRKPV